MVGGAALSSRCKKIEAGIFRGCLKPRCLDTWGHQEISLALPTEVQKKGWVVRFPNVIGRLRFTCFETLEGKATKSRQTSEGGRRAFRIWYPKGTKKNYKCYLPTNQMGQGGGWMNMIILLHKELLRDYNPWQRLALRMESQGKLRGKLIPSVSSNHWDQSAFRSLF